jgi:hypothetical protein
MRALLTILVIALLSGCYTERKAASQVHRAKDSYPDTTAAILRSWKPCILTPGGSDSGAYYDYQRQLEELSRYYDALLADQPTGDTLYDTLIDTWEDSTKIRALKRQLSACADRQRQQNAYISSLLELCRDKPPIHDTIKVRDSADSLAFAGREKKLRAEIQTAERAKKRAQNWLWFTGGWALLATLAAVLIIVIVTRRYNANKAAHRE